MKSIKLASGFAVSALALAIAGQATAQEATTEVEFTGSVQVKTVFDLEDEAYYNDMPGFASGDEDWFNLNATWSVTHGPFSGDIRVGIHEDTSAGNDGDTNGTIKVENLMVEEGPFSFGQIGSVADTAGLLEDLTNFDAMGEGKESELDYDVDAAFRYTVADLGLRVQAEGAAPDIDEDDINAVGQEISTGGRSFGVGAGIEQDLDVATVWADVQYRQFVNHVVPAELDDDGNVTGVDADGIADSYDGMGDDYTAFGAGVEATPVDMVSLTAVFRTDTLEDRSAYAVRADVSATDELSVFAQFADADATDESVDDSSAYKVGGSYDFAPITVEGSYEAMASGDATGGLIFAKLSYTEGPIGAFGEVHYNLDDFLVENQNAGMKFVVGADYTFDSGVVFGSEYENSDSDYYDGADVNKFTAFAEYSF